MASATENRSEKPTSRRIQKSREKGQVARSKEVPSAMVLLGGLLFLSFAGQDMLKALQYQLRDLLRLSPPADVSITYVSRIMQAVALKMGVFVGPFMLLMVVLGVTANFLQGGLAISWEALKFKFEKLSPKNGLSRVFSKSGVMELLKSLALLTVVSVISYQIVSQHVEIYPRLILMDTRQLLYWTSYISFQVLLRVSVFLLLLSFVDYAFQKRRYLEKLKMTKKEIKDELKDTEGDPTTRGRIRRVQREMARKRMMAEVPNADVVITNPTHYAVALSYKMESMEAPQVIAKGVGFLAVKIKELAHQHDILLVENQSLAQTLYKTVEVGQAIPARLYQAVAEILAYVYKARNDLPR